MQEQQLIYKKELKKIIEQEGQSEWLIYFEAEIKELETLLDYMAAKQLFSIESKFINEKTYPNAVNNLFGGNHTRFPLASELSKEQLEETLEILTAEKQTLEEQLDYNAKRKPFIEQELDKLREIRYKLQSGNFTKEIIRLSSLGYEPLGGVAVNKENRYQAMVKYEDA